MPRPYSADLRERVLLAGEAGLPPTEVARRFGIGLSRVYLWRQQARAEGRRCAKPHGGGRARGIDPAGEAILRALVAERNDRTLDEYREHLAARIWQPASEGLGSAGRPCAAHWGGWGCGKKKPLRASEQSLPRRGRGIVPTPSGGGRSSARGSPNPTLRPCFLSTSPAPPRRCPAAT